MLNITEKFLMVIEILNIWMSVLANSFQFIWKLANSKGSDQPVEMHRLVNLLFKFGLSILNVATQMCVFSK